MLIDSGFPLSIHHDSHLILGVEMDGKLWGEVSERVTIMPPIETLAALTVRSGALIDSLAWDEVGKMVRIGGDGGCATEIEFSSDLVVYLVLNQGQLVGISLDSKDSSIQQKTVSVLPPVNTMIDVLIVHDKDRDSVDSYSETNSVSENIVHPSCQRFTLIAIGRSFNLYRWN